jgi:hypothetical protein
LLQRPAGTREGDLGPDTFTTRDYKEILARKDIDAVIIGTPDHWHKQASVDAMKAGKDVYCEKPMIHLYSDGPEMIETSRATGRILQVGSQRVSSVIYAKAKELLGVRRDWPAQHGDGAVGSQLDDGRLELYGSARCIAGDVRLAAVWARRRRFLSTPSTSSSGASGRRMGPVWRAILFVHLFSGTHFITGSHGPTRAGYGRFAFLEGRTRRSRCDAGVVRLQRGLST